MARLLTTIALLSAVSLASCCGENRTPTDVGDGSIPPATATPSAQPRAPEPSLDTPVPCNVDSDCPHLSCGPCKQGDPVTERFIRVNCYRNPCPGSTAVCRAGVCVIK